MLGKMMDQPLLISSLIEHAAQYHGDTDIVSVEADGRTARSSWRAIAGNAHRLASALEQLGLDPLDRCATLAWNNRRHLEIYFGVSGAGYVCHTLNPRLHPEQMVYIVNHAEDKVLFIDRSFVPQVKQLRADFKTVEHIVLMGPRDEDTACEIDGLLFYDELLDTANAHHVWPTFDERNPSSLCYTSGTTGNPKGVLYSHRSTLLHTFGANQPDGHGLSARDTVLPAVPMFHANAWGVPYVAAAVGARLVLPGANLDGESLVKLIDAEQVTMSFGVPTIWMGLLEALKKTGSTAASMQRTVVGGSALPPSMYAEFRDRYGIDLIHGWGMTEVSPLGTANQPLAKHRHLPEAQREQLRLAQGRPPFGVQLRVVAANNTELPRDGKTEGNLQIKGFWIVDTYFKADTTSLTDDGWFDTGDVATLDPDGFLVIRDRSKDVIKSGGEWISSVELENIAIAHPDIANAAAVAAYHPKWDERPVLIAVAHPDTHITEEDVIAHYAGKVATWQVPDRVVFVDELPLGATGKVLKNRLRDAYWQILSHNSSG